MQKVKTFSRLIFLLSFANRFDFNLPHAVKTDSHVVTKTANFKLLILVKASKFHLLSPNLKNISKF